MLVTTHRICVLLAVSALAVASMFTASSRSVTAPGPPPAAAAAGSAAARLIGIHLALPNGASAAAAWKDLLVESELDAGRRMDLVSTSPYAFVAAFPSWRETWIGQAGSEPVIDWKSGYTPSIANGSEDGVLAARADGLKAFGSPVMLRYTPGMDSAALVGGVVSPTKFRAAWVRAHNVFAAHGVSNVSWVWCPTAASWANGTAMQWYPGAQYVDDVCAQGSTVDPSVSFASEFAPFEQAAAALGKPMVIDSFGVSGGAAGAKAQWITDAYAVLATRFTDISAAIEDGTGAGGMATSEDAESAWVAAVTQPALYTAPVTSLPTGRLVPPLGTSMLGAMLYAGTTTDKYRQSWDSLEALSSGNVDIAHTIYPWGSTVPTSRESYTLSQGRIPMISWGAAKTTDIIAGEYDAYIRVTATAIKNLGSPIFLRWFWEMDGTHFAPEAVSPADFKAAWAYIRAIFDAVGATNVVWVWCPTAYGIETGRAQPFYPGNDVVDWVAGDGFNSYPDVVGTYPQSFGSIFAAFYAWGTSVGKPMMVATTGALETSNPTAKASWIRDIARTIKVLDPGIRAICYLNHPSGWYADLSLNLHWEIGTSTNAQQAWSQIAQQPIFANAR